MAFQTCWHYTDIPKNIIDIIEEDLKVNYDNQLEDSKLYNAVLDTSRRNSKNAWVSTNHWIAGFLWHYIEKSNRENFLYDIKCIDSETLQYTRYGEGEYYKWHTDTGISTQYKPQNIPSQGNPPLDDFLNENCEYVRKISFSLLLSDPEEYEGGNLQFLDENGKTYFAPRKRGTMIIFDSRTPHRVLKVTKGVRKSIVGWVIGPRWR